MVTKNQPHADTTTFPPGVTKKSAYQSVLASLSTLLPNQPNWVCNTANTSSLLWHMFHSLPAPSNAVNWAGFYTLDPRDSTCLVLGPFQGKVACQSIRIGRGRGVCGESAATGRTVLVADVHAFPGHIACDGDSRSEIVVPVVKDGVVVAVIDIDCTELDGFDAEDQEGLEAIAKLLADSSEW